MSNWTKRDVEVDVIANQDILERAIQKAIDGGWANEMDLTLWEPQVWKNRDEVWMFGWRPNEMITYVTNDWHIEKLIFNHDFAKALWGEMPLVDTRRELDRLNGNEQIKHRYVLGTSAYEYHLQQMVIAEDPIKYLGDNL